MFNYAVGAKEGEVEFTYYPHAALLSGSFADRDQEAVTIKAFLQSREQSAASTGSQEQVKLTEKQYDELLARRLTTTSYTCRVKTLSQVIEENGIETIDLLKIDVEKAEWDVLKGIKPGHWPRIRQLVIEVHETHENRNLLNQITTLLESKGYRVAVEQVQLLEETRLYNLYAVMPPRQEVEKEDKEDKEEKMEVPRWYGIEELIRETGNLLKEKLPDYMVPAYIVPLGRLPLTATGKLARNALPDPEIKAGKNYVPPRHNIEKKLVKIWSEVLGRDELHASQLLTSIGIDDNFFELGGHSLKATIMISRIKKEMNVDVPLVEVFKTPGIRHLSGYIQAAERCPKETDESLVLLRKGARPDTHLFFIHDGSGEVEGYVEFCRHLEAAPDINCWGLRAEQLKKNIPQNLTIEEISHDYLQRIKKIQPRGPYFIAGWSIGGTIAFEIVRQMEKLEEEAAFFALIDSPPPGTTQDKPHDLKFTAASERLFIKKYLPDREIQEKLETITDINKIWEFIIHYLESEHFDAEIIRKVILQYEALVVPNYHQLSIGELIKYLNAARTLYNARASYIPREKIHTPVHYFAASQSKGIIKKGWNDYCKKSIKRYEIKGDHYSIFKMPGVIEFAQIFNQALGDAKTREKKSEIP